MDQFDREKAQRVWQRVQRERTPEVGPAQIYPLNPEGLLLEELTDARLFLQLSRQNKESASGPLHALAAQTQSRAAVLKGICHLSGLTPPAQVPATEAQTQSAALRRLAGRLLRRYQEYRQLCDHAEYAPIYEELSAQAKNSAVALCRLLGK